jgi:predicted TIM-barrel fold metal-dependent hydrolase
MLDSHLHAVSTDDARFPRHTPPAGLPPSTAGANPVETTLARMDAAGVDQACLVQYTTVYGYDNGYVADCVGRYPERFVGVCAVDPFAADAADRLAYWVERWGMRGLRLFTPEGWAPAAGWPAEPSVHPILETARSLALPVAVQLRPAAPAALRPLLERYPDVPLLLDHLASVVAADRPPDQLAAPLVALAAYPSLYLKFSTRNIRELGGAGPRFRALFALLIQSFGAGRLLWGSNFPATTGSAAAPYEEMVAEAQAALAFLPADDREAVFGGNAARLYGR